MKKTIISLLTGIIIGVFLFYGYYTYKYTYPDKLIKSIIADEIILIKTIIKLAISIVATIITLGTIYFTWKFLIKNPHKKLKEEKENLEKEYQNLQKEKENLKYEKQQLIKNFQEQLEIEKYILRKKAQIEIKQTKDKLEKEYQQKLNELSLWKKQENIEKENLRRKIKCLKEKILEIYTNKAGKFKETNPGRYKKEIKKAKKIIEECKKHQSANRQF